VGYSAGDLEGESCKRKIKKGVGKREITTKGQTRDLEESGVACSDKTYVESAKP